MADRLYWIIRSENCFQKIHLYNMCTVSSTNASIFLKYEITCTIPVQKDNSLRISLLTTAFLFCISWPRSAAACMLFRLVHIYWEIVRRTKYDIRKPVHDHVPIKQSVTFECEGRFVSKLRWIMLCFGQRTTYFSCLPYWFDTTGRITDVNINKIHLTGQRTVEASLYLCMEWHETIII